MTESETITVAQSLGYESHGYGYRKITSEVTHWITPLDTKVQLYAYFTEDEDEEKYKVYDTGVISLESPEELEFIATILIRTHN